MTPLFIYKHSPRCGTSRYVLDTLKENDFAMDQDVFILDVIFNRQLARTISERLQVVHESPQLLLIHKGECIWAEDHLEIDPFEAQREKNLRSGPPLE